MSAEGAAEREARLYADPSGPAFSGGDPVLCAGDVHVALGPEDLLCHSAKREAASYFGDADLRWRRSPRRRVTCHLCLRALEAVARSAAWRRG